MRLSRVVPLGALLLTALGCARNTEEEYTEPSQAANAEVAIVVDNHYWSDVNVYLLYGGVKQRLGMVPSVSTRAFFVPWRQLGSGGAVRLRADPIGGKRGLVSETVLVQPGQQIHWTLESRLESSSVGVY